jgi:short subunit fatty acids transporter
MSASIGQLFSHRLRRWIPEPFVFALVLTVLVAVLARVVMDSSVSQVTADWYRGFWMLLEFGMQMVLILATGFAIALSPPAARADRSAGPKWARTPGCGVCPGAGRRRSVQPDQLGLDGADRGAGA